jgi:AraC-like DNA-binding protein
MQFRTEDNNRDKVQTKNVVPSHCRGLIIPSAKVIYTEGTFGKIISQEINIRYYNIEYRHFEIHQNVSLYQTLSGNAYTLNYHLKGNVHCTIGLEEFLLSEDNYYLLHVLDCEPKMKYETGVYDSFHINIDSKYLGVYSKMDERLNKLVALLNNRKDSALKFSEQLFNSAKSTIREILNCPNDGLEGWILHNIHSNRLILHFLEDIQRLINPQLHQRNISSRKLNDIRTYIISHLEDELTIERLAKRFAVSRSSLSRHFIDYFDVAVHNFIKVQRLKKAAKLLEDNVSIREIAKLTGYSSIQAFSRAFSAYYGMSPSKYRKDIE